MPVTILCPRCGAASTFDYPPVDQCPHCDQPYPAELGASAESALTTQKVPRPALLTIGMYGSGVLGALMLLGALGAAFGGGPVTLEGESLAGEPSGLFVSLDLAVLGIACTAISYGLARGRTWTRPLMLLYWVFVTAIVLGQNLGTAPTAVVVSAVLTSAVVYLGSAAAYLYFKRNVVAYYEGLAAARGPRGTG